ncbi:MAG: hypothetical protein C0418_04915 [Coriobacteriaceae bacterium]|nr:hypothetical protein [Coriobacteriaceae bacterium]
MRAHTASRNFKAPPCRSSAARGGSVPAHPESAVGSLAEGSTRRPRCHRRRPRGRDAPRCYDSRQGSCQHRGVCGETDACVCRGRRSGRDRPRGMHTGVVRPRRRRRRDGHREAGRRGRAASRDRRPCRVHVRGRAAHRRARLGHRRVRECRRLIEPHSVHADPGTAARGGPDGDTLPDAMLTVSEVAERKATLAVTPIAAPVYDETGYTTQGGRAPYNVVDYYEVDCSLEVLDDGTYLLFYTGKDSKHVQWEHYRANGEQITSPQLGAGRLNAVPGLPRGEIIDTARIGDAGYVISEAPDGLYIGGFDPATGRGGFGGFLTPWERNGALGTDGKRLWLGTAEAAKMYRQSGGVRPAAAVMELVSAAPAMRNRARAVSDPPDRVNDAVTDIAHDATSDLLAVVYERYYTTTNAYELRLVVVDPKTLAPVREALIADTKERSGGGNSGAAVLSQDGRALVFWESGGLVNQHITTVDLKSGQAARTYDGTNESGIAGLTMNNWDVELVRLKDGPALLYLDRFASDKENASDDERHRFRLQPITEKGPVGPSTKLDGGQPILPDVTFDLGSLKGNPRKAICGSPCLLSGVVTNRGSRIARKVRIDVSVDGAAAGSLDVGSIQPGDSVSFAKVWNVPADMTADSVRVTYALSMKDKQYTTGNDSTETTLAVLQKGTVQGRVTNGSGVNDTWYWAPGLEGVKVSYAGRTVLTDRAGAFAIEEVDFGSGTLTAEKDGYNPVSLTVATTRTRPLAGAGIRMDDHGVLRFRTVDEAGAPVPDVDVFLLGYDRQDSSGTTATVAYSIPKGTYRFAFRKRGYHAVPPAEYTVELGTVRDETVTLKEAVSATLSGRVVDKQGNGVAGATVVIKDRKGDEVAKPAVDAEGDFGPLELPTKESGSYVIVATGNGVTVEEPIGLAGGDVTSVMVELIPGRGRLRGRASTEGYTSWMLKASWPGLGAVSGQDIFVWYGNHAMRVGTQYWDKSRELSEIDVTVWGGTYETHVTKGEIEFDVSGDDLLGDAGKGLPEEMAEVSDAESLPWWKTAGKAAYGFYKDNKDYLDLGKQIYEGYKDVKEAWTEEEYIVVGQGPELLTWKEAMEDFVAQPEWDSDHPLDSIMSYKDAIPTSFAIPIVIGGSSVQDTTVRVDGVDIVDKTTGEVYLNDRNVWYSHQGPEGDNSNYRRFEIARPDVPVGNTRVFVWVTVQKYWNGGVGGTGFDQREKQVIIFDPGKGGMKAFIAPGDLYKDPSMWDEETIERYTDD